MPDIYTKDSMAEFIENYLVDKFLVDTDLKPLKTFFIGEPAYIPMSDFPLAIVFITGQVPQREESGQYNYEYTGFIAVETVLPEVISRDEGNQRKARIRSYTESRKYLDKLSDLVEINIGIGGLTDGDAEKGIFIHALDKEYYLKPRGQDGFTNRGQFNISIRTQKLS